MLYVLLSKNCVGIHTQLTIYAKSLACNTTNKFVLTCTRRHSAAIRQLSNGTVITVCSNIAVFSQFICYSE